MKKMLLMGLVVGLFSACSDNKPAQTEEEVVVVEQTEEAIPVVAVANFEEVAGDYIDSKIKISGIVDHVCKHGGKKLLLVTDDADVHVTSDTRFDDELIGNEVTIIGLVREKRVDEGSCLQMEEDNTAQHKEGKTNDENFKLKQEMIQTYRDSMELTGVDHLSFYSIEFLAMDDPETN